ncbi:coiled-coil domain-containing protein 173 isoform X1 [Thamnophis elegans]|uniref:coiled-coil domain-containing protein 173 isoform X1 n=2 Tax=Thamnophis elegans TaxID=35005 RepID=UPI0013775191|nr:coiled-coil domain-containing protein 173 isoform X1 [Thamnophis elegans]
MGAMLRPEVRFGRRKGQMREVAPNDEDDVMEGLFLPVGVDLHQITILPKAEWQRIQDSLTARARETAQILAEKKARKDLHLKSQALVKNWTHTIAGMSQQKLKAKKVRQKIEEEEKRKADLEEAKYQAQMRKEKIEEAKLKQYYETDRVKSFHRALLYSEVLKERDAQIEFKKQHKNLYKSKNEAIERERLKAVQLQEEKDKLQHMKRVQTAKDQLAQIKEHEYLANISKLEEKKEMEELQKLTKLYYLEMQEKEQSQREEKVKRRQAHLAYVADQVTLRAIEKQKQEEEDERIQTHFKAKQAMDKLKKTKEEELRRLMEEQRERITNRLLARSKKKMGDEDERVAREIAEKEEEQAKEEQAKEEKLQADLKSIAAHRINVIKKKEEKEKEEKLEGQKILIGLMEADRIYQELEKDKIHRNYCANLKLQEAHVAQIADKIARGENEKQQDAEYVRQQELIALCTEQEFQKYANKVIDQQSKTTQNLYPLLKRLHESIRTSSGPVYSEDQYCGEKRSIQPPYTGETAQEMKLLNEQKYDDTKTRLGFTW